MASCVVTRSPPARVSRADSESAVAPEAVDADGAGPPFRVRDVADRRSGDQLADVAQGVHRGEHLRLVDLLQVQVHGVRVAKADGARRRVAPPHELAFDEPVTGIHTTVSIGADDVPMS